MDLFRRTLGAEPWQQILDGQQSVILSCGSGMTAAVLWLALKEAGVERNTAIYDEVSLLSLSTHDKYITDEMHAQSWTGYASRSSSEIVVEKV